MPPPFRASAADKIAAVAQILDSSLPFEQKLSRIATALRIPTAEPTATRPRNTWIYDDPNGPGSFDEHHHIWPSPPHKTESDP